MASQFPHRVARHVKAASSVSDIVKASVPEELESYGVRAATGRGLTATREPR
ncbi:MULTISPECIES: hypothetical protein [unclassified Rhizobium]|uniref:hypothetical protein n=1 Tax=unclassified Rhizobium TaxID=2613769 RepID=UPI00160FE925|nr:MULTISPECIES: hypothetical protein [unclassified Rhizobium]MBB3319308.1 hypothetical protein [Rhizobium sp. BK181]MBB3542949.1 hypothetical protein [Rhizobium sp. BK399]MCS3743049.1 hypothetical protein [Rhizobium sp. BK661]MCS4094978.1 hypothetical protein [Rhizobium sp. BK176]